MPSSGQRRSAAGAPPRLLCCLLAPALVAGGSGSGSQLRGDRGAPPPNRTAALTARPAAACHEDAFGLMLERMAPLCAKACPQLCLSSASLLQLHNKTRQEARNAVCGEREVLSCALQAEDAEACRPLAEAMAPQWPWPVMPTTAGSLAALCEAGAAGDEAGARVELRSAADASWSYFDDPTCKHPGVREGQTCVPKQGGGYSDSYIYCSAHRRISPGVTYCPNRMGPKSRCVGGGIGLTHDYCDDPFCRNGGAYAGDGKYCDRGSVVWCKGDDAPVIIDSCSDSSYYIGDCEVTDHYECVGGHNQARCEFSYSSRDGSNC